MPRRFTPRERRDLWACLKTDDGARLNRALNLHKINTLRELDDLRMGLWKDNKGKGGARHGEGRPVSLFTAAATNKEGLPVEGSIDCMRIILNKFGNSAWPVDEREDACKRVEDMDRMSVREFLIERGVWV
jgi:hypothetical protein